MRTPEEMAQELWTFYDTFVPKEWATEIDAVRRKTAALLAAWRDECVAEKQAHIVELEGRINRLKHKNAALSRKPEAPESVDWRDKIRAEQLIEQIRLENNVAERETQQGDGWITDHSSAIRELNADLDALLSRAPRAESEVELSRYKGYYKQALDERDAARVNLDACDKGYHAALTRAESAEAERDQLRIDWDNALEDCKAQAEAKERTWTECDRLRSALTERPPKAYYEGLLSDKDSAVTLLREENEALRAGLAWIKRVNAMDYEYRRKATETLKQADNIRAKGGES